jgi:hypothetical protein
MVLCAFLLTSAYWLYLLITSQMLIVQDAVPYHKLGVLLHDEGWAAYFVTGPNREPLYPFLIAVSMKISEWTLLRWDSIQKIVQCLFLLNTQILMLTALRRINAHRYLTAFFILYIGISPSLVSCAFSLYSEIASILWPLGIVLLSGYCWTNMAGLGRSRCFYLGMLMALLFVCLTFVKGIFEMVTTIYMSIFWVRAIMALKRRDRAVFYNLAVFLLTFSFFYYGLTTSYKFLNKSYNKQFTITDRGPRTFYSAATERTEPLNWGKLPAYLSTIPGNEFCFSSFDRPSCLYWSTFKQDGIGGDEIHALDLQGITGDEANRKLMDMGIKRVLLKPVHYFFFTFLEASRIFFWESTHTGFVVYPRWLEDLYGFPLFSKGISILTGVLMACSFYHLMAKARTYWGKGLDEGSALIFFSAWMILIFISLLSMCSLILERYLLTLAPLYIIVMAYFLNGIIGKYGRVKTI